VDRRREGEREEGRRRRRVETFLLDFVKSVMEKACRDCHRIVGSEKSVCNCGSNSISKDWSGYVVIINAEGSEIAKKVGINKEGRYALKVR
jgi:DNA-directed RNA polymerase subunit E"